MGRAINDGTPGTPMAALVKMCIRDRSMTLLQNKDNILPLKKTMKVAVMGPNATDSVTMCANYNGIPNHTTTILEGIKTVSYTHLDVYKRQIGNRP